MVLTYSPVLEQKLPSIENEEFWMGGELTVLDNETYDAATFTMVIDGVEYVCVSDVVSGEIEIF